MSRVHCPLLPWCSSRLLYASVPAVLTEFEPELLSAATALWGFHTNTTVFRSQGVGFTLGSITCHAPAGMIRLREHGSVGC